MRRSFPARWLLFWWLFAWSAAAHAGVSYTVPLRFYGTRAAVEVRVNGKGPFLFLVDTGAAGPPARADASLVRRLSIASEGRESVSDGGGGAAPVERVTLGLVEIGGLAIHNVSALSRDYGSPSWLPKIDGILGPSFFAGRLLTIDFPRGVLRIEDGELPAADGATILDYQVIEGNFWIPVHVAGRTEKAVLDTGNIRWLDLPSEALKPLHLASFPRPAGGSSGASGTTAIREVRLKDPLRIGRYAFEMPAVTFSDDFHEINVGASLLQEFTITLDQRNRRVRLVRAAAPKR